MHAKTLYAATVVVALFGSTAAMATEATQLEVPAGSLSRAAVKAELAAAQANGQFAARGDTYGQPTAPLQSTLTRAEVRAELARWQASGAQRAPMAVYGYAEPPVTSVLTREEVRAEARAALGARRNAPSTSYGS